MSDVQTKLVTTLEPQNQALAWLDSRLDNPRLEKLENLRLVAPLHINYLGKLRSVAFY